MKKTVEDRIQFIENTPDTTVDVVVVTEFEGELLFLLNRRSDDEQDPFPNKLGLCGVYFDISQDNTIEDAAIRGIKNKAHLESTPHLEFLGTFSNRGRDPRWHTLTVVMLCYVNYDNIQGNSKYDDVEFLTYSEIKESMGLAFDHEKIIDYAYEKVKKDAQISAKVVNFLPEMFTLAELQKLYERVLGDSLDKSSFRKQVALSDLVVETNDYSSGSRGKPAKLFTVNSNFDLSNDWFFPRSVAKNKG